VLLCVAAFVPAQQSIPRNEVTFRASTWAPRAQYVLKTETRIVEVGVVVRDSRGHSVGGLTRQDFKVEDGGKPVEITAFTSEIASPPAAAPQTAPPMPGATPATSAADTPPARYMGLLFDDLSMGPGDLISARSAAKSFVTQGVSPGDLVAIFSLTKGQVAPFTSDTAKLNDALDRLGVATRNPALPACPNLSAYESYVIANNRDPTLLPVKVAEAMQCGVCQRRDPRTDRDCPRTIQALATGVWESVRNNSAIALNSIRSVVDYMATLPGKRVLLMASSGFLSGTLEFEREDIVNHALRGNVVIHALDSKGLFTQDLGISRGGLPVRSMIARQSQGTRPQSESNDTMAILAASTGGLFFHSNNDLELGFRELGLLPEFFYSLDFTPRGEPDGKYHTLKVRLKDSRGYEVQARPGYFSAVAKPTGPPAAERRIDREMLSAETLDEVPLTFSTEPAATPPGETGVHVVLHLDIAHLQLVRRSGLHTEQLTVIAALFDAGGNFITGKECEIDFRLKDDTFSKLSSGTTAGLTLKAPPGKYQLRGVVREANQGKYTASSQPVQVQ
jgi:VWFA-related protein